MIFTAALRVHSRLGNPIPTFNLDSGVTILDKVEGRKYYSIADQIGWHARYAKKSLVGAGKSTGLILIGAINYWINMKRKIIIAIAIVAVVLVGLVGIKALQIRKMVAFGKTFVMPPETISSAVAHEEKWQDTLSAVGSISAWQA